MDISIITSPMTLPPEAIYTPDFNWRSATPAQVARAVARANQHLSPALIDVLSWTPKGSKRND